MTEPIFSEFNQAHRLFDSLHLWALFISIAFIILIPLLGRKLPENKKYIGVWILVSITIIQEIFDYFHKNGAQVVCLTLGANGVKLSEEGQKTIILPAEQINEVMDATGAGDAFWSGFLYSYVIEKSLQSCLEIALKLAALKLQHVGRLPNNINVISQLLNSQGNQ